jgi:hypothetical protein
MWPYLWILIVAVVLILCHFALLAFVIVNMPSGPPPLH